MAYHTYFAVTLASLNVIKNEFNSSGLLEGVYRRLTLPKGTVAVKIRSFPSL